VYTTTRPTDNKTKKEKKGKKRKINVVFIRVRDKIGGVFEKKRGIYEFLVKIR
jgi:hypothetical protein